MRFLIRVAVASLFLIALPLAGQVGKWTAVADRQDPADLLIPGLRPTQPWLGEPSV